MKKRLFRQNAVLILATVLISSALVCLVMYNRFFAQMQEQVKTEAVIIAAGIKLEDSDYLKRAANASPRTRMTIIRSDGGVIFDSIAEAQLMENHLDRPEVMGAMLHGTGEDKRPSETLGHDTFYYALRLDGGDILRIAETTQSVYGAFASCLPWMAMSMIFVMVIAVFISKRQVKSLMQPINTINLEQPMSENTYDEIAPLLSRIEKQRNQIEMQMESLAGKQAEFAQIADNMREGLVLLNTDGEVLTINRSAQQILATQKGEGAHIIELCRTREMQSAVENAMKGRASTEKIERDGRVYRIHANPVIKNQMVVGAIILLPDITELYNSEQMRREFSANVSHELKTPLTSISGYAELMVSGMVKPQDLGEFSGRIYTEAQRLIALVTDIISLSQLDEQSISVEKTEVDLREVVKKTVQNTADVAQQMGVSLEYSGDSVCIFGVAQLLERMLNNLCENAIKYNNFGGYAKITTGKREGRAYLEVLDNGIGIPKNEQSRVFERFYRVDKSHSKETGGTGLGLSIVKHIVLYHGGELELKSTVGQGTCITVLF